MKFDKVHTPRPGVHSDVAQRKDTPPPMATPTQTKSSAPRDKFETILIRLKLTYFLDTGRAADRLTGGWQALNA